jgi:hypothetical protein
MSACDASPNTTPCHTATPGERLRLARIALKAKQDDISALWELSNRQVISDWERGRAVVPDEMLPKIEQLETWAAAGGKLDAVRAEIARVKDRELAAQIERAHNKATSWQAMGSRPVPLIERPAQLTLEGAALDSSRAAVKSAPVEPAAAAAPDPYTTTIDWQAFVVEVDGNRGVSLRELVKAGLYASYQMALAAAQAAGLRGFQCEIKNSTRGRPGADLIMPDVRAVQKFCVRSRTPVGEQIADLILDHHAELQRLIAGDADAHQRLADVQPPAPAPAPALSPMMVALQAAMEHEAKIIQLQHDVAALQRAEAIRREESERMLSRLKGAGLPEPTVDAPALTTRKALVAQLARVGMDAGNGRDHHHAAWVHLYSQYEHRAGVDLRLRAINAGQKTLEYAETHGHLDALYALACELWPPDGAGARA